MKVVILTEGGKSIGFGHLTRCLSLYEAFQENGINPKLVINGDKTIHCILKNKKYIVMDWVNEQNNVNNLVKNKDVIIIDSYLAGSNFYKKISEIFAGRLVVIDDYNRIKYPNCIIVNPSFGAKKIHYHERDGVVYLLGKEFIMLRKQFWKVPKKYIREQVRNILVTFGGINHSNFIIKLTRYLKDKFNFNFNVIDYSNRANAKDMLNHMLAADICISGGGQTIYELARCGTPTISICLADNQRFNLASCARIGFITYAGWYTDKNISKKIAATINGLNYQKRLKMSKIGGKYVDGFGAIRLVRTIMNCQE